MLNQQGTQKKRKPETATTIPLSDLKIKLDSICDEFEEQKKNFKKITCCGAYLEMQIQ